MRGHGVRFVVSAVVGALLLASACGGGEPASAPEPARPSATATPAPEVLAATREAGDGMCGFAEQPPERYKHVIWIWFENRSYGDIVGSPQAPYMNKKIGRQCGLATNFHNETHPSLPNYIAAIAGKLAGVDTNCGPQDCTVDARSLLRRLEQDGKTWGSFSQSMPEPCADYDEGRYAVRHNPAPYFSDVAKTCRQNNVRLGKADGPFATALKRDRLPSFSFVTPNMCRGMHDCSVREGDEFLSVWIPRIVNSDAYRSGRTAVVITWDEGSAAVAGRDCLRSADESCHIATYVLGPAVQPGVRVARKLTHYSLLRATQNMLGVKPYLANAQDANRMRGPFGL